MDQAAASQKTVFRLLDFEFDTANGEVSKSGVRLPLEPKVVDLLLYLLRHRARVVSRKEILENVWRGVTVSDHTLSQALHSARKALGDSAKQPSILKTVRGRGISLVAEVRTEGFSSSVTPLIGRDDALSKLRENLLAADSGSASLCLVVGSAGIGKSRLCDQLRGEAESRDWCVLTGRCSESEVASPFHPWFQLMDGIRDEMGVDEWQASQVEYPELRILLDDSSAALSEENHLRKSGSFRLQSFGRICEFLRARARKRPLLLLLEDIHHADRASAELIRYVVDRLDRGRVLVLCTYREFELRSREDGRDLLVELTQRARDVVELAPLSFSRMDELAAAVGTSLSATELRALHRRSGGNPLFWLRLHEYRTERRADDSALPASIRDLVVRQLRDLPFDARELIDAAAVVGRRLDVDLLCKILDLGTDSVASAVMKSVHAGILRRLNGSPHKIEFVHAVVRDAVYESLAPSKRCHVHAAVAEAYRGDPSGRLLVKRAQHLLFRLPVTCGRTAVEEAVRAAWDAIDRLAFEEALPLLEHVRSLATHTGTAPEVLCRLLVGLGECHRRSGRRQKADGFFRDACALAEEHGMTALLEQIALRLVPGLLAIDASPPDSLTESVLRQAHRLAKDPVARGILGARLAMVLYWGTATTDERRDLVRAAELATKETQDPLVLGMLKAYSLGSRWGPGELHGRSAESQDVISLGQKARNAELEALGHIFRITCLLESGDGVRLRQQIQRLTELVRSGAAVGPQAFWYVPMYESMAAMSRCEFSQALSRADEFLDVGRQVGGVNVELAYSGIVSAVAFLTGESPEAESEIDEMIVRYPDHYPWRTARLMMLTASGGHPDASSELEELLESIGQTGDRPLYWLVAMSHLADACCDLGNVELGRRVACALAPFETQVVSVGYGVFSWGPVARPLGRLWMLLGEHQAGLRALRLAVKTSRRAQIRPWELISRADLLDSLKQLGSEPGALDDAAGRLQALSEQAGMRAVARRCRSICQG